MLLTFDIKTINKNIGIIDFGLSARLLSKYGYDISQFWDMAELAYLQQQAESGKLDNKAEDNYTVNYNNNISYNLNILLKILLSGSKDGSSLIRMINTSCAPISIINRNYSSSLALEHKNEHYTDINNQIANSKVNNNSLALEHKTENYTDQNYQSKSSKVNNSSLVFKHITENFLNRSNKSSSFVVNNSSLALEHKTDNYILRNYARNFKSTKSNATMLEDSLVRGNAALILKNTANTNNANINIANSLHVDNGDLIQLENKKIDASSSRSIINIVKRNIWNISKDAFISNSSEIIMLKNVLENNGSIISKNAVSTQEHMNQIEYKDEANIVEQYLKNSSISQTFLSGSVLNSINKVYSMMKDNYINTKYILHTAAINQLLETYNRNANKTAFKTAFNNADIAANKTAFYNADIAANKTAFNNADIADNKTVIKYADTAANKTVIKYADIAADRAALKYADKAAEKSAVIAANKTALSNAAIAADRTAFKNVDKADNTAIKTVIKAADITAYAEESLLGSNATNSIPELEYMVNNIGEENTAAIVEQQIRKNTFAKKVSMNTINNKLILENSLRSNLYKLTNKLFSQYFENAILTVDKFKEIETHTKEHDFKLLRHNSFERVDTNTNEIQKLIERSSNNTIINSISSNIVIDKNYMSLLKMVDKNSFKEESIHNYKFGKAIDVESMNVLSIKKENVRTNILSSIFNRKNKVENKVLNELHMLYRETSFEHMQTTQNIVKQMITAQKAINKYESDVNRYVEIHKEIKNIEDVVNNTSSSIELLKKTNNIPIANVNKSIQTEEKGIVSAIEEQLIALNRRVVHRKIDNQARIQQESISDTLARTQLKLLKSYKNILNSRLLTQSITGKKEMLQLLTNEEQSFRTNKNIEYLEDNETEMVFKDTTVEDIKEAQKHDASKSGIEFETEPTPTSFNVINENMEERISTSVDKPELEAVNITKIADQVYKKLESKLRIERQRKGLFS